VGCWQIQDIDPAGRPMAQPTIYDDGDNKCPSDPGFSLSAIVSYAAGRLYNFMGVPNWKGA
jgi:hypothetical protein